MHCGYHKDTVVTQMILWHLTLVVALFLLINLFLCSLILNIYPLTCTLSYRLPLWSYPWPPASWPSNYFSKGERRVDPCVCTVTINWLCKKIGQGCLLFYYNWFLHFFFRVTRSHSVFFAPFTLLSLRDFYPRHFRVCQWRTFLYSK